VSKVHECINMSGPPSKKLKQTQRSFVNTLEPPVSGALTAATNIEIQSQSVNVMPQYVLEAS
jgi:hypothetical protein